ncbi:MAG: HPr(Ser) kinase/phosphatase [Thioalkalispiraceae bacterium]|jgi:HPr kinase/phosphorylase
MQDAFTVQQFFEAYAKSLELSWVTGQADNPTIIPGSEEELDIALPIGFLNLVRPYRIQVLGSKELEYLSRLGKNSRQDSLNSLFQQQPAMLIMVEGNTIPEDIQGLAQQYGVPILASTLPGKKLIELTRHYLNLLVSDKTTRHGVFMDVLGIGVLLTGPSGIGKSELALELINRGHRLVADDAPEFKRIAPNNLRGGCPNLLKDFLEVRGIGILNVRAMFGDNALIRYKRLRLIVDLEQMSDEEIKTLDRLGTTHRYQSILDVDIPEVVIPVAPGRNIAVIVEAAVRNHILAMNGYHAAEDFMARQQEHIKHKD